MTWLKTMKQNTDYILSSICVIIIDLSGIHLNLFSLAFQEKEWTVEP